jgi:hypothetical protein
VVVVAVLALSFVADGVPGRVRTPRAPSGQVAAVQSGPSAPGPLLRRDTSVGDGRFGAARAGSGRAAVLLPLLWFLWLLGLGPGTAHRTPHATRTGFMDRRGRISLRAPPRPA